MSAAENEVIAGKVVCAILRGSGGKEIECATDEEVKKAQETLGSVVYYMRYEADDGITKEEQLGYGEGAIGKKAYRFMCKGDGGHVRWMIGQPTEEDLNATSCAGCEF